VKKLIPTIVFLLISTVALSQTIVTGKVVSIADGDTFTILVDGNKQVKVRFHGIDCPESNQDFGTKSKQFTSQLAFAKMVKVQVNDTDRYGRSIGIITLPDGKILNEELLKAGLAWHYKHYDKSERYALLENQAKADKVGVWSMKNAVAPWEFRRSR
jgi:micrococcal nuclease